MDFPRRRQTRVAINRGLIAETGTIPDGYKFLRDSYSFTLTDKPKIVMSEDISGKKVPVMRVQGLFQEAEKQNANGRVYPYPILAEATKAIEEDIIRRGVLGELDHPSDAKIHMDRVSHLVTKAWMDGNKLYGEAEVLDNQFHGAALRGLFERRVRTGISSRGVGDMEMRESAGKQFYVVSPGYSFVTWDSVCEPSVGGAYLAVMESLHKKTKPIAEASNKARRQNNLLEHVEYERMLVSEVHKFFGTRPLAEPAKKLVRRTYNFK